MVERILVSTQKEVECDTSTEESIKEKKEKGTVCVKGVACSVEMLLLLLL